MLLIYGAFVILTLNLAGNSKSRLIYACQQLVTIDASVVKIYDQSQDFKNNPRILVPKLQHFILQMFCVLLTITTTFLAEEFLPCYAPPC